MNKSTKKTLFIAERTLICAQNPRQNVVVKLAKPKLNARTKDYECAYQITGKGVHVNRWAAGLDSFQALQLALSMIGVEIGRIEKAFGLQFRFSDLQSSGFPSNGVP
jgi:hypothetical protein